VKVASTLSPTGPRRGAESLLGSWQFAGTALLGLVAGLTIGAWLHASGEPVLPRWVGPVEAIGAGFVRVMRAMILPLVVCLVIGAVGRGRGAAGGIGARSLAAFIVLLAAASAFTLLVTPPLLVLAPAGTLTMPDAGATGVEPTGEGSSSTPPPALHQQLLELLPENPVRAAADANIVQLLVFSILLALGITGLEPARREALLELFHALADALMWMVRRILLVVPLAVFSLALGAARRTGFEAAGVLGHYLVVVCGVMLLFTALLYPASALGGGVRLRDFAAAALPGQIVGFGTRSSIAALPALVDGASRRLGLPARVVDVTLPMGAAMFKLHGPVSNTATLFVLAHAYSLDLTPLQIGTFVATTVLMSFTMIGLPDAGGVGRTLPAYLVAGIPLEGYFLSRSVEAIVDYVKTLLNVTGHMAAVTLSARGLSREDALPGAPWPQPAAPER
jgi:Na+/H+-dicarboxylate symporter